MEMLEVPISLVISYSIIANNFPSGNYNYFFYYKKKKKVNTWRRARKFSMVIYIQCEINNYTILFLWVI